MNKDQLYELEKAKLIGLEPAEYERRIKEICEELKY